MENTDTTGPGKPLREMTELPPLTPEDLPEAVPAVQVARLVTLETHVALLEEELRQSRDQNSHAEFQLRTVTQQLRAERLRLRKLRTEFKRTLKWLDQIVDQTGRLYASRRWRMANFVKSLGRSQAMRPGFPGLDAILSRYRDWKVRHLHSSGIDDYDDPYATWLSSKRPSARQREAMKGKIEHLSRSPLIGLVLDLSEGFEEESLQRTWSSISSQTFTHWRLLIRGPVDGSAIPLPEDSRINRLSKDEFAETVTHVAGVGVGDRLEEHALAEIALFLEDWARHPDLVYTDEDETSAKGALGNPFLKPAWSPDTLESTHYTGALAVYRKDFLQHMGAGPSSLAPDRAYETVLRASEQEGFRAEHLAKILYHRLHRGVAASERLANEESAALEKAMLRRGQNGTVEHSEVPGIFYFRRKLAAEERVTIFIPTRDRLPLLKRCLETLTARTSYRNYEVTIINNESRDPATLAYLASCGHKVFDHPGPFNYAAMHNAAVAACDTPWIVLLNNDTEIIEPGWLQAMAEHVQRPEVAAVGAKLLYPDGSVQHAGVILGIHQRAAHAFAGANPASITARGQLQMIRNYSAVTAACLMMRREVYESLGGFDAERFPVAYNDVELCVRATRFGYRNVYTPLAVLKHHECATRPRRDNPDEVINLHRACFGTAGWTDPYYHPWLNHGAADFAPAF